jgi:hypothetical protein
VCAVRLFVYGLSCDTDVGALLTVTVDCFSAHRNFKKLTLCTEGLMAAEFTNFFSGKWFKSPDVSLTDCATIISSLFEFSACLVPMCDLGRLSVTS